MGRYITAEAVIVRLMGKVKTTDDPDTYPDRLPLLLLNRLINEAEGQVEQELSPRYAAPFQNRSGEGFMSLPERPTREIIRTLCELLSVIRVLETDFGRGSGLDGAKYASASQMRYDVILYGDKDKGKPGLISLRDGTYNTFRQPPLPGLRPNYHMGAADNGFSGYVGRTDDHAAGAGYAIEQINDPGENYFNGVIEPDGYPWQ